MTSDLQIANPQVDVKIDRDKASALGVTAQQVEDALYTAYGQRQISTIYAPNDEYLGGDGAGRPIPEGSDGALAALHPVEHRELWFRSTPSRAWARASGR